MGKRFSRTVRLHVCCRTPDHDFKKWGRRCHSAVITFEDCSWPKFLFASRTDLVLPDKNLVVLWPLFHYILWDEATDGRVEKKNWDDYVFVNQQFADAILEQYQPGDIGKTRDRENETQRYFAQLHDDEDFFSIGSKLTLSPCIFVVTCNFYFLFLLVWIHDYHLLLVPHLLRQKLPGAAIGVFIHAPFPSSEIFRCLPSKFRGDLSCY